MGRFDRLMGELHETVAQTKARLLTGALVEAAAHGRTENLQKVLAKCPETATLPDNEGTYALHAAAQGGHTEVVELLLAAGADPGARDCAGLTPLHLACRWGATGAAAALAAGAGGGGGGGGLNARGPSGQTPLHEAAEHGHADAARRLAAAAAPFFPADPLLADARGRTPRAVAAAWGRRALAEHLFAHESVWFSEVALVTLTLSKDPLSWLWAVPRRLLRGLVWDFLRPNQWSVQEIAARLEEMGLSAEPAPGGTNGEEEEEEAKGREGGAAKEEHRRPGPPRPSAAAAAAAGAAAAAVPLGELAGTSLRAMLGMAAAPAPHSQNNGEERKRASTVTSQRQGKEGADEGSGAKEEPLGDGGGDGGGDSSDGGGDGGGDSGGGSGGPPAAAATTTAEEGSPVVRRVRSARAMDAACAAVLEAQRACGAFRRRDVLELRRAARPPPAVALTLEAACLIVYWPDENGELEILSSARGRRSLFAGHQQPAVGDSGQGLHRSRTMSEGVRKPSGAVAHPDTDANPVVASQALKERQLRAVFQQMRKGQGTWDGARLLFAAPGFHARILAYAPARFCRAPDLIKLMKSRYIPNPNFNHEAANNGSLVCGALFKWILGLIEYYENSMLSSSGGGGGGLLSLLEQPSSSKQQKTSVLQAESFAATTTIEKHEVKNDEGISNSNHPFLSAAVVV